MNFLTNKFIQIGIGISFVTFQTVRQILQIKRANPNINTNLEQVTEEQRREEGSEIGEQERLLLDEVRTTNEALSSTRNLQTRWVQSQDTTLEMIRNKPHTVTQWKQEISTNQERYQTGLRTFDTYQSPLPLIPGSLKQVTNLRNFVHECANEITQEAAQQVILNMHLQAQMAQTFCPAEFSTLSRPRLSEIKGLVKSRQPINKDFQEAQLDTETIYDAARRQAEVEIHARVTKVILEKATSVLQKAEEIEQVYQVYSIKKKESFKQGEIVLKRALEARDSYQDALQKLREAHLEVREVYKSTLNEQNFDAPTIESVLTNGGFFLDGEPDVDQTEPVQNAVNDLNQTVQEHGLYHETTTIAKDHLRTQVNENRSEITIFGLPYQIFVNPASDPWIQIRPRQWQEGDCLAQSLLAQMSAQMLHVKLETTQNLYEKAEKKLESSKKLFEKATFNRLAFNKAQWNQKLCGNNQDQPPSIQSKYGYYQSRIIETVNTFSPIQLVQPEGTTQDHTIPFSVHFAEGIKCIKAQYNTSINLSNQVRDSLLDIKQSVGTFNYRGIPPEPIQLAYSSKKDWILGGLVLLGVSVLAVRLLVSKHNKKEK